MEALKKFMLANKGREWDEYMVQRIFGSAKLICIIPYCWIHVIVHFSNPIKCTTPSVNTIASCGLWVIMMSQHSFIDCNQWGKARHVWW